MSVRASSLLFDRVDLTDHERVVCDRGHNQRASERRRGVGQWNVLSCRSIIELMLVVTRNTWSRCVYEIRVALRLKPSQWVGYPSSDDR
jgi:hypothetical protein